MGAPVRRLLLVDDEPLILKALERAMFMHQGWEVVTARGGAEALAVLATRPIDAVVSDMRMPGMDGATLLCQVLALHPGVVRIVLSGHTELAAAIRAVPVAQQFLGKPCDTALLVEVLERATRAGNACTTDRMRTVVGGVRRLPANPVVWAALGRALGDPRATVADLTALVEPDAVICAKLLQLANSAFVGTHRRTGDLPTAVGLIGVPLLRTIVQTSDVFCALEEREEPAWSRRAREESLLTVRLLRKVAPPDALRSGELSTASLLRDVGIPLLRQAGEREADDFTHAQVGACLLTLWGLPPDLVALVAHHHEPWCLSGRARERAGLLWAADRAAREVLDAGETPPLEARELSFVEETGLADPLAACRQFARDL